MRRSRWVAVVIVIAAHAALLWALMAVTMLTEAISATAAQPEARLVVVNIAPRPHATPTPTSSTPPANASPASTTRAPLAPRAKAAPRAAPVPAIAEHAFAPDNAAAPAEPVAATSPTTHDDAASPATPPPPPTLTVARAAHSQCALAPYPPALKEQGIEGVVRLRILVNSEGRAAEVQMMASSGWRLLDQAALAQARGCRFVPAHRGAQPVDDWVEFPMRFALNGSTEDSCRTTPTCQRRVSLHPTRAAAPAWSRSARPRKARNADACGNCMAMLTAPSSAFACRRKRCAGLPTS